MFVGTLAMSSRVDFFAAAKAGDVLALEALRVRGIDLHSVTSDGCSAVMLAALYRREAAVRWCLHWRVRGCVDAPDYCGSTAVHYSASMAPVSNYDDPTCLRLLVGAGADVNVRDVDGATPLHLAARCGSAAIVQFLATLTACDMTIVNVHGRTAEDEAYFARAVGCADVLASEVRPFATGNLLQHCCRAAASLQHCSFPACAAED